MGPLFDRARHEALTATPWSEDAARRAVEMIAADAMRGFEGDALLWRAHPLDEPEPPDIRYTMLYFGAGGVIWALRRLQALGAISETLPDFSAAVATLVERNHRVIAGWGYDASMTRSYLMGDAGLHLLQWQTTGDAAATDALYRAVAENLDHPAREPLWGSPGTMLPALHMAESTGDPRWAALF